MFPQNPSHIDNSVDNVIYKHRTETNLSLWTQLAELNFCHHKFSQSHTSGLDATCNRELAIDTALVKQSRARFYQMRKILKFVGTQKIVGQVQHLESLRPLGRPNDRLDSCRAQIQAFQLFIKIVAHINVVQKLIIPIHNLFLMDKYSKLYKLYKRWFDKKVNRLWSMLSHFRFIKLEKSRNSSEESVIKLRLRSSRVIWCELTEKANRPICEIWLWERLRWFKLESGPKFWSSTMLKLLKEKSIDCI
ncbi:hypothetical protein BpHYR1_038659 [Brachionus plicatilis]|uniref:Uncharacterized protein n=1 Tax=Brachionus plicatilis TaxID=10195 RepID=A0A3M7RCG0_BRAPC|nr:hypothetical protein BpHYR1_038659 [Brachionus plicatilis]